MQRSVHWGNMEIRAEGNTLRWTFDDDISIGNERVATLANLGCRRAAITALLWQRLGLKKDYQNGWFLQLDGPSIVAREIHRRILQVTVCPEEGIVKETAFQIGEGRIETKDIRLFLGESIPEQAKERSWIIAERFRKMCEQKGTVRMGGIRISWGLTKDEVLTPVGGFGLPDNTRFDRTEIGACDRRFAKMMGAGLVSLPHQECLRKRYDDVMKLLLAH